MAAGYAHQGQIGAFNNAVQSDCFLSVGGTTGIKSAIIAHEGAEASLVTGNNKNQQTTH
jgi:hypothetical protein